MTHTRPDVEPEPEPVLAVAAVLAWADGAVRLLERARHVMDRANVFPVPDADTGANLVATLTQARDAAHRAAAVEGATSAEVLGSFARGALVGSRGSSGVIMSEFLRGYAAPGAGDAPAGLRLARAIERGARLAYDAVGDPRPGTMLSAARGAADAALRAAAEERGPQEVLAGACTGADEALRRSVDDLDDLRRAGVLDAGAYGLVLVLAALRGAVEDQRRGDDAAVAGVSVVGETIEVMDSLSVVRTPRPSWASGVDPGTADGRQPSVGHPADSGARHCAEHPHDLHQDGSVDGEFELMCTVRHTATSTDPQSLDHVSPALRGGLQQVGDSVVVVGGAEPLLRATDDATPTQQGLWQVHVHTDRPLDVLALLDAWDTGPVVVRCLAHQVAVRGAETGVGVVAGTSAPGLVMDLARSGAVVVLRRRGPVGPDDLLRAVLETDADDVLLLPADPGSLRAARDLAQDRIVGQGTPRVTVADSSSDLHVVAALSAWGSLGRAPVHAADLGAALVAVSSAVGAVHALRADGGDPSAVHAALAVLLEPDEPSVARAHEVPEPVVAGTRRPASVAVLTVLVGDLVPESVLADLVARAERLAPGVEVVVLPSGRRSTALVIGAEPQ